MGQDPSYYSDDEPTQYSTDDGGQPGTVTRSAFAHDAVVILHPGGDTAGPGGAITVALCGRFDHEPPCPLAPHHTAAEPGADGRLTLRVLFAPEISQEKGARDLIERALRSGRATAPDGSVTGWTLQTSCASDVRPEEADHAARLVAG